MFYWNLLYCGTVNQIYEITQNLRTHGFMDAQNTATKPTMLKKSRGNIMVHMVHLVLRCKNEFFNGCVANT